MDAPIKVHGEVHGKKECWMAEWRSWLIEDCASEHDITLARLHSN